MSIERPVYASCEGMFGMFRGKACIRKLIRGNMSGHGKSVAITLEHGIHGSAYLPVSCRGPSNTIREMELVRSSLSELSNGRTAAVLPKATVRPSSSNGTGHPTCL